MTLEIIPKTSEQEAKRYEELAQKIFSSIQSGELDEVKNFVLALRKNNHFSALILSQVLTELHTNWADIQKKAKIHDDFISYAESEYLLSPQTVVKYTTMWRTIFQNPSIPAHIVERLKFKPINFLLRLVAFAQEDPSLEDWERVLQCDSISELRELIRELRGETTSSKTAVVFYYDIRTKTLTATHRDKQYPIAVFAVPNKNDETHIELIAKLLTRIGAIVK